MRLVRPSAEHLASYANALQRGWSPDNLRPQAGAEELARLDVDPVAFLASLEDRDAVGPRVTLPDGTVVDRLPGVRRWMWDGEFCGTIGLRWQPGTAALPPHCMGHIGYAVVPWKRGAGHATAALAGILPTARIVGLPFVDITTDIDNLASRRVIEANRGELIETFTMPASHGGTSALRYRIRLE